MVIAIIALLAAVAAPGLMSARELARRAVCAGNLRRIGTAVANYAADNCAQLMCSQSNRGGAVLPPHIARVHDPDWDQKHDLWLWNIESIDPYVQAFSRDDSRTGGVFVCPSAEPDHWRQSYRDALDVEVIEDGQELIVTPYAYYAHVSSWDPVAAQNGAADELTDGFLEPGRVLMSDMIWLNLQRKLQYNHGADDPALPGEGVSAPAPITGVNRLYGDGAAGWRDIGQDEADLMGDFDAYIRPYVNDSGSGDTFYY